MFRYLQTDKNGLIVGFFDSVDRVESVNTIAIDPAFDALGVLGHAIYRGEIIPKPAGNYTWDGSAWANQDTPENEWINVRKTRDRLLATTDWTQLPDVPLAAKESWASYRQALRDITLQPDPFNIVWPQPPISQS